MSARRLFATCVLSILLPAAQLPTAAQPALAAAPRVLPPGQLPRDARLGPQKDLNGYFPFQPYDSVEAWNRRAEQLRRQVLVSQGLWPMPEKTPANTVIHGRVQREGYTVERVFFESVAGHFVTGSLYRPAGQVPPQRRPAVLCPHGHWAEGRFYDVGPQRIRQEIVQGAERFEIGGRSPLQSRCVQLARMGCVVFHYDMIGYADSVQLAHRPGVREEMNTRENWGFFSPQAELRLQTMMGLQTYNSIRALDFLASLDDVDPQRIAVTGASGGGTQTFILCAADPRPAVSVPAVMVSTAMQGGCTCENACYLRVGTGNIELAALFAPKPLGLTAANDWTRELASKGLPELESHYKLLGAVGNIKANIRTDYPHNYNYVNRAFMYGWLNRHLKLGLDDPIVEEDYVPLSRAEMTVWSGDHAPPPSGPAYERSLLGTMTAAASRQLAELTPRDTATLDRFREVIGGGWDVLIGRSLPEADGIDYQLVDKRDHGDYLEFLAVLGLVDQGEQVPTIFFQPKPWKGRVVVWIEPEGKSSLYADDGSPRREIRRLLAAGYAVAGADLFYQGEFLADGQPLTKVPLVTSGRDNWKTYAGYTYGYNHPLFSRRVHDILTLLAFVRSYKTPPDEVHLVGLHGAGRWVAAAAAQAGHVVDSIAADTAGFRFESLAAVDDPDFVPGAVKYGDLPALLALCAPHRMLILGEGQLPPLARAAYDAAQASDAVTLTPEPARDPAAAAVDWLLR